MRAGWSRSAGNRATRPPLRRRRRRLQRITSRTSGAAPARRRSRTQREAPRSAASAADVVARVDLGERLAGSTSSPRFAEADDADRVVDRLRRRPRDRRRAPSPPRRPPSPRARGRTRSPGAGTSRTTGADGRPSRVGVASLRANPALVRRERGAVAERLLRARPSLLPRPRRDPRARAAEPPRRRRARGSPPARRRSIVSHASRTSSALPTARPSGWSMSVSTQTTSMPACVAERTHLLRELARVRRPSA